jgi:hypothetical protein
MDANGAKELAKRFEAHEHWRQADAGCIYQHNSDRLFNAD